MKYFALQELTKSTQARRLGIDNTPDAMAEANLRHLVEVLLDPLREAWRDPLYVTSGYRCTMLNNAVGGVKTSAHAKGLAADIITGRGVAENVRLFDFIRRSNLPYDQVINERGGCWVHVAASAEGAQPRRQALDFDGQNYHLLA